MSFLRVLQPLEVSQILSAAYGALVADQMFDRQDCDRMARESGRDASSPRIGKLEPSIAVRMSMRNGAIPI